MKRSILRHAFIILTVSFALGLVAGASAGSHSPGARAWLASHLTGIMVSILMSVVAFASAELRLGARAMRVLWVATVPANYLALVVLGILGPALGATPALLAGPDTPPTPPGVEALVVAGIVVASVSSFVMSGLVIYGLRGTKPA
jgi:hypothetical protein